MTFTDHLYETAKPIWEKGYQHPFVQGIGDGTLDPERFSFFMCQDYVYLIEYARLFALGSLKAPDLSTMSTFAKLLDATLNMEMELHRQYAEKLGISREELEATEPAPTTLAYSSYMLNLSQRGSLAELIAALLPCAWSYGEIGERLAQIPGAVDHPLYGEWIRMYDSEDFKELATWLIDLLNELAEGKSETEKKQLETIFIHTSKFEYLFWDMAWEQAGWTI
ncbi:thiaminase II [Alkalihalobacillus oceani]|uniref:thiaminase II n=1 Tax=Halalkalibacter oceani TaxID=1653776 RepID=UPI00203DFA74|nr:thiaminase II [Halalkalibacter oceani]MCM3759262.1 thiaminase II [Halalkalibacter oceani]